MSWTVTSDTTQAEEARIGTWRVDGRGVVVLVPGRGDSLELREPVAEALAVRGLSTVMVEHVGQGASGHLGRHPDAVHVDDFDIHVDAAIRVVQRACALAPNRSVHLLAHSMGGLVAAHLLGREPTRYAGAVLTAPMWGFAGGPPLWVSGLLASTMTALGMRRYLAIGEKPWQLASCLDMRTGDPVRRAELEAFARSHRDLVRGGSTWGWVRAAIRAMVAVEELPLEQVRTRTVTVSAQRDGTVSTEAIARTAPRLPNGRLITVDGGHDVFNEGPAVQDVLWRSIDEAFAT